MPKLRFSRQFPLTFLFPETMLKISNTACMPVAVMAPTWDFMAWASRFSADHAYINPGKPSQTIHRHKYAAQLQG